MGELGPVAEVGVGFKLIDISLEVILFIHTSGEIVRNGGCEVFA